MQNNTEKKMEIREISCNGQDIQLKVWFKNRASLHIDRFKKVSKFHSGVTIGKSAEYVFVLSPEALFKNFQIYLSNKKYAATNNARN